MRKYLSILHIIRTYFINTSYLLYALHLAYYALQDQQLDGEVRLIVKSNTHLILFTESIIIPVMFRPSMMSVWVCDEQSGTGTAFSLSTSVPPLSLIPPVLHIEFHSSK